jgi:hypothetical protein
MIQLVPHLPETRALSSGLVALERTAEARISTSRVKVVRNGGENKLRKNYWTTPYRGCGKLRSALNFKSSADLPSRIDNNEYSGLFDDLEEFKGEVDPWLVESDKYNPQVARRLGWGGGKTSVGRVGRTSQTIAMAKVI